MDRKAKSDGRSASVIGSPVAMGKSGWSTKPVTASASSAARAGDRFLGYSEGTRVEAME